MGLGFGGGGLGTGTMLLATSGQDWSPHMSFIFKGSQILAVQLKGRFQSKTSIQEYRYEIQNSYIELGGSILPLRA